MVGSPGVVIRQVGEAPVRSLRPRSELFHKCGWSASSVAASVTDLGDRDRPRALGSPARKGTGELDRRRTTRSDRCRFLLSDLLWISLWELGRKAQISGKPRVPWREKHSAGLPMMEPVPPSVSQCRSDSSPPIPPSITGFPGGGNPSEPSRLRLRASGVGSDLGPGFGSGTVGECRRAAA